MIQEQEQGKVGRLASWDDLPADILILVLKKLCFLDVLSISMTCNSWYRACLNAHAFSIIDFRDWTTVSKVIRDRFHKHGDLSVTEDQIFDYILSFAVNRSLGCETSIIYPNHQRVPNAMQHVKKRCPNIKVFCLGYGGEYWHGRKVNFCCKCSFCIKSKLTYFDAVNDKAADSLFSRGAIL